MNLKKPLLFINICLVVFALFFALNVYHTWKSERNEKTRLEHKVLSAKSLTEKSLIRPKKKETYEIIINRDIFKTKNAAQKEIPEKKKSIKITDLNLKLMGTVVGKERDCFAIIMDGSTKKLGLYHLNDFIQGTRIVGILSDRVILNLEGEEECLLFTKEPSPSVRKPPPKKRIPSRKRKRRKHPMI